MAPPALPAVGMATRSTPNSLARLIAMARPRLLKDPVGSCDSSLTHRSFRPRAAPSRSHLSRGDMPSPSEAILDSSATGSSSW